MKFKLNEPIRVNGKDGVTELNLHLEKLTGRDVLAIERDMNGDNGAQSMMGQFAARGAGVAFEDLLGMSAGDYMRLTNTVAGFFGQPSSMSVATDSSATDDEKAVTEKV